jgi:23S rRNA (uracil1939-C5)-methyltransferase
MARHRRKVTGPPAAAPVTAMVEVAGIGGFDAGGAGWAVATISGTDRTLHIPHVLAGETVEVRVARERHGRLEADLLRVVTPAPERRTPACRHFAACGGCALQHWPDEAYVAWKVSAIRAALQARGIESGAMLTMARSAPASRRRADVTLVRTANRVIAGFARRASHDIVDLAECPVTRPQIVALLPHLRAMAATVLPVGTSAEAVVNWTGAGADVLVVPGKPLKLDLDRRTALAAFADDGDVARVCWGTRRAAEPVVVRRAPRLRFGGVDVEPPPGAFLQATDAGERALQGVVGEWTAQAKRIADLHAGIGTLSLGLLPARRVTLVEGDRAAVAAVNAALRRAALAGTATAVVRDLARDPLPAAELDVFDAVIFDPPRAGATAQAAEIARSGVPSVIAVSCDPVSFARDARLLVDGGYRLETILPVDQFLWSPHIEMAALFRRG